MEKLSLGQRIKSLWRGSAGEGQYREAWGLGELGSVFLADSLDGTGFQRNLSGGGHTHNTTVAACVTAYSWALAAVGIQHVKKHENGEIEVLDNSAAARCLRYPNAYQTQSDFVISLVGHLLYHGNTYAWAKRNGRYEIAELHPIHGKARRAIMASDGDGLYYDVRGDWGINWDYNADALVPSRDVFHVKLYPHNSLLHGESPITNAALSAQIGTTIQASSASFLRNMSRPSGVLTTEAVLTQTQTQELRARWNEQSAKMNQGNVPILGGNMKWVPMSISANDAQIIATYNVSVLDIARVFRIPPALIGIENAGAATGIESLINQWRATGLMFIAEHIERSLERLFELPADEEFRFDLDNLARSAFAEKITALTQAIQHGAMAPNEARRELGLKAVEFGDDVRVQAQAVPLSQVEMANSAPSAPAAASAPGTSPASAPNPDAGGANNNEPLDKGYAVYRLKQIMGKAHVE